MQVAQLPVELWQLVASHTIQVARRLSLVVRGFDVKHLKHLAAVWMQRAWRSSQRHHYYFQRMYCTLSTAVQYGLTRYGFTPRQPARGSGTVRFIVNSKCARENEIESGGCGACARAVFACGVRGYLRSRLSSPQPAPALGLASDRLHPPNVPRRIVSVSAPRLSSTEV